MVMKIENWPPGDPRNPDFVDHYEPDEGSSTGIGILILGATALWVWGVFCGWLLTWIFLKS